MYFLHYWRNSFDYDNTEGTGQTNKLMNYSDTLTNGHLGLVYNITRKKPIYISLIALQPIINGGESDVGAVVVMTDYCG